MGVWGAFRVLRVLGFLFFLGLGQRSLLDGHVPLHGEAALQKPVLPSDNEPSALNPTRAKCPEV